MSPRLFEQDETLKHNSQVDRRRGPCCFTTLRSVNAHAMQTVSPDDVLLNEDSAWDFVQQARQQEQHWQADAAVDDPQEEALLNGDPAKGGAGSNRKRGVQTWLEIAQVGTVHGHVPGRLARTSLHGSGTARFSD